MNDNKNKTEEIIRSIEDEASEIIEEMIEELENEPTESTDKKLEQSRR